MWVVVQKSALATRFVKLLVFSSLFFAPLLAGFSLHDLQLLALKLLLSFTLLNKMLLELWHTASVHLMAELVKRLDHAL